MVPRSSPDDSDNTALRGGPMTGSTASYYELVDRCALASTNTNISNAMPEHARYLIDKMCSLATKSIRLYTGRLRKEVRDQKIYADAGVINAFVEALARKVDVRVLIEHRDAELADHPLFVAVKRSYEETAGKPDVERPSQLFYGFIADETREFLKDQGINTHFLVIDRKAYRLEKEHPGARAIANFGNPTRAMTLFRFFDKTVSKSAEFVPL
jgi:hypothetical protein